MQRLKDLSDDFFNSDVLLETLKKHVFKDEFEEEIAKTQNPDSCIDISSEYILVDKFDHPVSRQEEDCKYYIHFYLDDMTIPLDTHAQQGTTFHYKNFYCFFVYSLVLNKRPPPAY